MRKHCAVYKSMTVHCHNWAWD